MLQTVICTALLPEARALARAFVLPDTFRKSPVSVGPRVAVALVGPRAGRLSRLREHLAVVPQSLVMAGLGGALAPDLRVGDVVLDAPGEFSPALCPGARRGTLATSQQIVATPTEKAALFAQTGALAVDMETSAARALAAEWGVPFLALRAISDAADEPLDADLLTLVDDMGRPRAGRALALLARRPGRLPGMLRLQRRSAYALSRLSEILVALVATGWPGAERFKMSTT